jgi:predicted porin
MAGGTFRVSQGQTDQAGKIAKQTAIGFVNPLSKRTDLYATYARVANSGGSAVALNGASTAANASSTGYEFGVKHSF